MAIPLILVPLLEKGLSLIANAAMAKGKSWVKEKTGVDLDKPELTSEDYAKLKQYEMEHELELAKLLAEDNKIAANLELAYLADTDSARKMQVAALQQDDVFSKRFVYWFALFWAAVATTYIFTITFIEIPDDNQRFADVVLGFLLGTVIAQVINFFFGSSRSSQRKDEVIGGVVQHVTRK